MVGIAVDGQDRAVVDSIFVRGESLMGEGSQEGVDDSSDEPY